jgi:hypothetical protein
MLSPLLALFACGAPAPLDPLPPTPTLDALATALVQEEDQVPATEETIQKRLGLWETQTRKGKGLLLIERNRMALREDPEGEVQYFFARHLEDRIEALEFGKVKTFWVRWDRKTMLFAVSDVLERDFQPSSDNPGKLEVRPLPCPKAKDVKVGAVQIQAWNDELIERGNRDQSVRHAYHTDPSSKNLREMQRVDQENIDWLLELLPQAGWPDGRRFSEDAAHAAFLIVQHSGRLDLMWTAREALQAEVRAERFPGGRLALLHDRLQLALGYPQKYGSQIQSFEDGTSFVAPLLNPERVDAYRAEVGLEPLEKYLEFFAEDGRLPQAFEWPLPKPREATSGRR